MKSKKLLLSTLGFFVVAGVITALAFFVGIPDKSHTTRIIGDETSSPLLKEPDQLFYKSVGRPPLQLLSQSSGKKHKLNADPNAGTGNKQQFTLEIQRVDHVEKAKGFVEQLKKQGIDAYYMPFNDNGHIVYIINAGVYADAVLARSEQQRIQTKMKLSSQLKTL